MRYPLLFHNEEAKMTENLTKSGKIEHQPGVGVDNLFPFFVRRGRSKADWMAGYIDSAGRTVIPAVYDHAGRFREGLATVQQGRDWGVIAEDGSWRLRPFWDSSVKIGSGRIIVGLGGKYGLLDTDGKELMPLKYDAILGFSESLAVVRVEDRVGDRHGFINLNGEEVIPLTFERAGHFKEGLAPVKYQREWYFIDRQGKFVFKIGPVKFVGQFENGLARYEVDGRTGYINTRGEVAIEPKFAHGSVFSEGLAAASAGKLTGFIDRSGSWAVSPRFYDAIEFSEGLAGVKLSKSYRSGSSGFIDPAGNLVIPAKFRVVDRFEQGLSLVETEDEIAYINRQGEFVWRAPWVDAPIYSNLRP
jgi:hypothetical protein